MVLLPVTPSLAPNTWVSEEMQGPQEAEDLPQLGHLGWRHLKFDRSWSSQGTKQF